VRWSAADEGRHRPGGGRWWQEAWEFDAWWDGGRAGVCVHVSLLPDQRRAWYWAALVRPAVPVVVVHDLDVALPRQALELRAAGLWADHVCETPFDHWTVANEAHGVALDDPEEGARRGYGDVVAMAFDLEWEQAGEAQPALAGEGLDGYVLACEVHGEIHLADGALTVAGQGARRHWWGERGWFDRPWGDAEADAGAQLVLSLQGDGRRSRFTRRLARSGWTERNQPVG